MKNIDIEGLLGIIWVIVWIVITVARMAGRKREPQSPAEPQSPPAADLPEEARQLLSQAAAREHASANAGHGPSPFAGDERSQQSYNELNLRDTEYLLRQWYADDPAQWSDEAFAVIERILIERLGRLPSRDGDSDSRDEPSLGPDEDVDPFIKQLWLEGDLDGLARTLKHAPDWLVRMDAAEALAAWNDSRGYDFLTESLDDPADDVRAVAREILDELAASGASLPAEAQHVEAGSGTIPSAPEESTSESDSGATGSNTPGDIWAAYRQKRSAFESEQTARVQGSQWTGLPATQGSMLGGASQGQSPTSRSYFPAGTAGGLLGIALFYALLYFSPEILGQTLRGVEFTWGAWPWLIPVGLALATLGGAAGDRLAQGALQSLGWEPGEGDTTRMLSAGLAGLCVTLTLGVAVLLLNSL